MGDDLMYLSCHFGVVRFNLRQTVPIFDVGVELVVVLVNVDESVCAKCCCVENYFFFSFAMLLLNNCSFKLSMKPPS